MVCARVKDVLINLAGVIFHMVGPPLEIDKGQLLWSLLGYPPSEVV